MSKTYVMALPILAEKIEQWKTFVQTLKTDKQREYESARQKAGVRSEKVWHQHTPQGDLLLQVVELDGSFESFIRSLTQPRDDFGQWFLAQIEEIHGVSAEQMEAMPANEQVFAWTCPSVLEKAGETALGIGQNLAQTAQGILGKATETAESVGKKVSANTGGFAGKAQTQAQEAAHQFQEKAQETAQQLQHQAQETAQQLQQQAQEKAQQLQQQAQEVRKNVEIKATELLNQAGDNVAEATQQMQAKASEALENAAEVGQAVAEKASGLFNQALGMFAKKENKPPETPKETDEETKPSEEAKA
jgi:cell division septum initiation protein DivIVA